MTACRFCSSELEVSFLDLGHTPLSNAYLSEQSIEEMEPYYPLHALFCQDCFLVQNSQDISPSSIFKEYAYFSSYSSSWLSHARHYVESHQSLLKARSQVIEIASNDGYLLQYFDKKRVNVLGVEPAKNIAEIAIKKGINTRVAFFSETEAYEMKRSGHHADLIIANNVLAHVPDINSFLSGIRILLKSSGFATFEFPHLLELIKHKQFDTIYHEHFFYFSISALIRALQAHGLDLYDLTRLSTHGGSLRIYVAHQKTREIKPAVTNMLKEEEEEGLLKRATYESFAQEITQLKQRIRTFLVDAKNKNKKVIGYGAPAKGNTLLNYCGIDNDLIDFVVDKNIHKQNTFLPGSHLSVKSPETVFSWEPDYLIIMPWNIKDEIMEQMKKIRKWGGKFVTFIPEVSIF